MKLHTKVHGYEYARLYTLPESLCNKALKMIFYLLNRVSSKTVIKIPYELWTGKSPNIRHLHVWGCPAKARPYILYEKKLDLKTVSCLFVGYFERYRGFRFYCPSNKSIRRIMLNFFEDIQNSGSQLYKDFIFEEEKIIIPMTIVPNNEVVVLHQHKNIFVPLQGIYAVHLKVDPAEEIEPENS